MIPPFQHFITSWLTTQLTTHLTAQLTTQISGDQDVSGNSKETLPQVVDIGCVFALYRELGGLLDLLPKAIVTQGTGFKYYQTKVGKQSLVLVESGVGATKAEKATEALISTFRPSRVVSAGFAGGLVPSLDRNRLVIPNQLICQSTGEVYNLWTTLLSGPEQQANSPLELKLSLGTSIAEQPLSDDQTSRGTFPDLARYATGSLLSASQVITTTEEKKKFAQQFGATLVDMETWSVAKVCRQWSVPFLPLRIIFDPLGETLPKEVSNLTQSSGSMARMAGALFGALVKRPSSVVDLFKMNETSVIAADLLGKALQSLLTDHSGL